MDKFTALNDAELEHVIEALADSLDTDDMKQLEYRQRLRRFAEEEKTRRN